MTTFKRSTKSLLSNLVLYADRAIMVLNKPPGLVCQPGSQARGRCVIVADLKTQFNLPSHPCPVHRLDKAITGALLLARNADRVPDLMNQFQKRTVRKTYLALVRGGRKSFPEPGRGTIDDPLQVGRDGVTVDWRNGQPALSDWELLGSSDIAPLSLLWLTLHSGIKHQLRVHCASVLHAPILGDSVYSQKPPASEIASLLPRSNTSSSNSPRMFLHASHISLSRYRATGPHKQFRLGITAPLPNDFSELCRAAGLDQHLTPDILEGGLDIDGRAMPLESVIDGVDGRWHLRS
ncbi:pseudouridine synthase [Rickenella mellea]|uniref:21S rRNA pseudouridine(2819) synthase n=1 Tax=Rickenella mellea TaxID=50990 RepID=A0A4Y7Q1D7_9AGAM|nr:pseudouridine synthase [Rickenella mellea]